MEKSREYYIRVSNLAKKSGVPWRIAILVGDIVSDDEAIEILKDIELIAKNKNFEALDVFMLSSNIENRKKVFEKLIKDFDKIECEEQKEISVLADYLLFH